MPRELRDYLDLTATAARAQWRAILERVPGVTRQPPFEPVEVVLCYGLFHVVDPHKYGGSNIATVPAEVHALAALFTRSLGSVTAKMLNLDGSRANAGAQEWRVFAELCANPDAFLSLYRTTVQAARDVGVGPDRLPDFLSEADDVELLGQDEVKDSHLHVLIDRALPAALGQLRAGELVTSRVLEYRIRLGQHRFARQVLANFGHACAFCGFSARELPSHRMLVASHIKPWAVSSDTERLDYRNGVAACPTHDSAFDTGLITVNGGFRIHRAAKLEAAMRSPGVSAYFGAPVLRPVLAIPEAGAAPRKAYFDYHREHIFRGAA